MTELRRYGLEENPLLLTDSYKLTHWKQYPPKTQSVFSYFESRGGEFPEVLFFGLQYILKTKLEGIIVTEERINDAEEFVRLHLGDAKLFNREGWEYILKEHGGKLPLSIRAVPEGTVVPILNALITIENTDPKCAWLVNYVEDLLVQTWYPLTVATLSMNVKKNILYYLEKTGTPSLIDFKLHDFGFRGVSSVESAMIGGAAHLVNFKGTDTLAAILMLRRYYSENMAGLSIPAAEHSTITSWGKDNEAKAMKNMLEQFPTGLVAIVSDSYDIFNACSHILGTELKGEILKREGTVVVRPDSGNPEDVVLKVLNILGEKFGYSINRKGYKVLNDKVRVIQGDGVDPKAINAILQLMCDEGWSADNITFGMGGGLLQKLNRDTQKIALKCSSVTIDGEERDVYKQPVTDLGKRSKAGKLKLVRDEEGKYSTVPYKSLGRNELVEVFRDGKITVEYTLKEIRERANRTTQNRTIKL